MLIVEQKTALIYWKELLLSHFAQDVAIFSFYVEENLPLRRKNRGQEPKL